MNIESLRRFAKGVLDAKQRHEFEAFLRERREDAAVEIVVLAVNARFVGSKMELDSVSLFYQEFDIPISRFPQKHIEGGQK